MSSSKVAQISQDIYEIHLPHHSRKFNIKQFTSIGDLNTLKIGRLWWDNQKTYRMRLLFDDDCIETINTDNNYEETPEVDYSIHKVKADKYLIVTVINDNYHFDYLPPAMVQGKDRLHNYLWHKYLSEIY